MCHSERSEESGRAPNWENFQIMGIDQISPHFVRRNDMLSRLLESQNLIRV
jgi:hypothetical protein